MVRLPCRSPTGSAPAPDDLIGETGNARGREEGQGDPAALAGMVFERRALDSLGAGGHEANNATGYMIPSPLVGEGITRSAPHRRGGETRVRTPPQVGRGTQSALMLEDHGLLMDADSNSKLTTDN